MKKAQSGKRTTRKKQKHVNKKTKRGGSNIPPNTWARPRPPPPNEAANANAANANANEARASAMKRADNFSTRTGKRVLLLIGAPVAAMAVISSLLNG